MVTHVVRHGRVSPNYANRDRLESDGFPLEGPRGTKGPTCFCVEHTNVGLDPWMGVPWSPNREARRYREVPALAVRALAPLDDRDRHDIVSSGFRLGPVLGPSDPCRSLELPVQPDRERSGLVRLEGQGDRDRSVVLTGTRRDVDKRRSAGAFPLCQ